MSEPMWTQDDVEAVAQSQFHDRLPPDEVMQRLGPTPPREFLVALGGRFLELAQEREAMSEPPNEPVIDAEFDELLEASSLNSPAVKSIRDMGGRQIEEWAKRQSIRAAMIGDYVNLMRPAPGIIRCCICFEARPIDELLIDQSTGGRWDICGTGKCAEQAGLGPDGRPLEP